ncbi:uncharacterized protein METZ01_LOCUS389367, partial [marine metagenome]
LGLRLHHLPLGRSAQHRWKRSRVRGGRRGRQHVRRRALTSEPAEVRACSAL